MNRPEDPHLDRLLATVDELRVAEERLTELKQRAGLEARALASITDPVQRINAGIYAYWFAPEVHAADIAFGVTGREHPGRLLSLAGPVSIALPCDRCAGDIPIHSRAMMKETLKKAKGPHGLPEGFRVVCPECWDQIREDRSVDWGAAIERRDERSAELQALPYSEYLTTDDWARQLNSFLSARFQTDHALHCEACGGDERIGCYHRSLGSLGHGDDIVLLCKWCFSPLNYAGRIAGQPSASNLLSASLVAQHTEAFRKWRDGGES
jgi:hypothetical protein